MENWMIIGKWMNTKSFLLYICYGQKVNHYNWWFFVHLTDHFLRLFLGNTCEDCSNPNCRCACDPHPGVPVAPGVPAAPVPTAAPVTPATQNPNSCAEVGNVVTAAQATCVENSNNTGCLDCMDYTTFSTYSQPQIRAELETTFSHLSNTIVNHCWVSPAHGNCLDRSQCIKYCFTSLSTLQQCGSCT